MDLDSTLIRAEALFKRFHRLVDAVDKKGNFPAPRPVLTPAPESSSSAASTSPKAPAQGAAAGRDTGKAPARPQSQPQSQQQKVITPELRALLSRKVEVLPRKEVAKKGMD
jgi:TBC1 domain family member 15